VVAKPEVRGEDTQREALRCKGNAKWALQEPRWNVYGAKYRGW
jgi:hypothetical protein